MNDSDPHWRKGPAGFDAAGLFSSCWRLAPILASIFAARAADRSGELAIRLAIGSSRWNVVRQLVTEAVIVSAIGGLVGSSLAWVLLRSLSHWQPFGDFPTHFLIALDARVYLRGTGF